MTLLTTESLPAGLHPRNYFSIAKAVCRPGGYLDHYDRNVLNNRLALVAIKILQTIFVVCAPLFLSEVSPEITIVCIVVG